MLSELCRCKLCGGEAEVSPSKEEVFEADDYTSVSVCCADCNCVDVWAMPSQEKIYDYKKLRAIAVSRWNRLMEEK